MAFPVILSQIGQITVQLADTAMVGRYGGDDPTPLAAVSFATSLFFIVFITSIGLTFGLTPLVGERFAQERHRHVRELLQNGLLVFSLIGVAATLLLVRIPLTNSFVYVVALAAPVTAAFVLLTMNKLRGALKEKSELSNEELIVENVAVKETSWIAVLGGVSLILVGAIATTAVRWFAVCALIALVVSFFVGVLVAPAWYLPIKNAADKKAASRPKNGYVGAEKQEKKEEKTQKSDEE